MRKRNQKNPLSESMTPLNAMDDIYQCGQNQKILMPYKNPLKTRNHRGRTLSFKHGDQAEKLICPTDTVADPAWETFGIKIERLLLS